MGSFLEIPVVIPAYEPSEKLILLIRQLRKKGVAHIIVVDDGSGPAFEPVFAKAQADEGCVVLRHAVNLGKGRALKTAFNYCLQALPEVLGCVTADSDGQHTAESITACMKALCERPDALVLGCRNFDMAGVPARSSFGNKCTRKVFRYLLGLSITDTQTGLRAIPLSFMRELMNVKGERFEYETNMLIETKNRQIPIIEVAIDTIYIEENKSSHFNPIKDSVRIYLVFGKFLFSSLSASVLDLMLFGILCSFLRDGGGVPGVSYIVQATVFARIISAVYNFAVNYKVVFRSKSNILAAALRYGLLALCQMMASAFLVDLLFGLTGGYEVVVKMAVDVILFFISFVIQREFVYRKKAES